MITGNVGPNQLPMKERAKNVLAELVRRKGVRRHFVDSKVVDYLLKKKLVKITKSGYGRTTHSYVVPIDTPEEVKVDTGGPYAKRKAALEEAGLNYRGKPKEEEEEKPMEMIAECYLELTKEVTLSRNEKFAPGFYYSETPVDAKLYDQASCIWGVTDENKVFYVKSRATNPKKGKKAKKVNMEEFMWVKLRAKKVI